MLLVLLFLVKNSFVQEKKYNLIQILRGFAAIFVMLYHATRHYATSEISFLGGFFKYGFFGVDIFFVLSGFVIYLSSYKYLENGNSFDFLKKRIIRIYPSFWFFLLIPLTIVFLVFPQYISDKSAFELSNYINVFFLLFDHPQISQISWTLSFELYFYLLFFLVILNKKFKYLVFLILIGSFVNLVNIDLFPNLYLQKYLFSPLILEFFLGVLVAIFLKKSKNKNNVLFGFLFLISIVYYFAIPFLSANDFISISKHNRILNFGFASFLLILSLVLIEKFNAIKSSKLLILVGDSSYVLYLIHSVILSFFDNQLILSGKLIVINNQITTLLVCSFIVFLSVFLHKYIEKPMLKYLNAVFLKPNLQK